MKHKFWMWLVAIVAVVALVAGCIFGQLNEPVVATILILCFIGGIVGAGLMAFYSPR
jgi:hypothetical protein